MMIGRESQLAVVHRAAAAARSGRSTVVIVEGPAGSGRTRLAKAVIAHERNRGMTTMYGRGSEMESDFAYGVVGQLLENLLDDLTVVASSTDWPPHEQLHKLYLLVHRLAEREPLLIVVDDVHLADEPSLRWLAYLALRLGDLPIALVLTIRAGER